MKTFLCPQQCLMVSFLSLRDRFQSYLIPMVGRWCFNSFLLAYKKCPIHMFESNVDLNTWPYCFYFGGIGKLCSVFVMITQIIVYARIHVLTFTWAHKCLKAVAGRGVAFRLGNCLPWLWIIVLSLSSCAIWGKAFNLSYWSVLLCDGDDSSTCLIRQLLE